MIMKDEHIWTKLLFLIILAFVRIITIREKRIKNFFISHGYNRKLVDISLFGEAHYIWKRESDGKVVDDLDIKNWSLRRIKKEYE